MWCGNIDRTKMKVLFVLALLVVISTAQWEWLRKAFGRKVKVLDNVHNYRFEEHLLKKQKLLVVISDTKNEKECHVIEIDNHFHKHLKDKEFRNRVSEDIYDLIHDNEQKEKKVATNKLVRKYKDQILGWNTEEGRGQLHAQQC